MNQAFLDYQLRRKAAAAARQRAIAEWRDSTDASISMTAKHFAVSEGTVTRAYTSYGRGMQFGTTAYCRTLGHVTAN